MDRAWYAASQALVRDHREALAAVLDHLTRQGGATSVRCVEGVYVYLALIPDAELLPRLPRERTRVCGRDCRFPDFVLENVLRYAASLENT